MTRAIALLTLAASGSVLVGCKSTKSGAREYFETTYSCPKDRVTLKPRADILPEELLMPPALRDHSPPPDEVKRDPGRYAEWRKNRDAQDWRIHDLYADAGAQVFQVTGCGHTVLLACLHPNGLHGPNLAYVTCQEAPKAP